MSNTYGKLFQVTTWGDSHGKAMGAIVDGCPAGLELAESDIQVELDRRRPRADISASTQRLEGDTVEILSGVFEGKTTGAPISMIAWNNEHKSEDYDALKDTLRPGHADLAYTLKYGHRDHRGGGRSSGRETISRVMGGAIAKKILQRLNKTEIYAYTVQIGDVVVPEAEIELKCAQENSLRIPHPHFYEDAEKLISMKCDEGDSIGGTVEILIKNPPIGLGQPCFNKLHAELGKSLLSIGGVKGFEIGDGLKVAYQSGSTHNDPISKNSTGDFTLDSNHCGGIQGGISIGTDILLKIGVKPPSSIGKPQKTTNTSGTPQEISIIGRHDACLIPRILPVAESMVAMCLVDMYLQSTPTFTKA